jgi:hypothetical protein
MAGFGTKQNDTSVSRRTLTTKKAASQVLHVSDSLSKFACMRECHRKYYLAVDIRLP